MSLSALVAEALAEKLHAPGWVGSFGKLSNFTTRQEQVQLPGHQVRNARLRDAHDSRSLHLSQASSLDFLDDGVHHCRAKLQID